MTQSVRAFKLTTGEEIIATYNDSDQPADRKSVVITRPRVINVQQVAPGQFSLALAPWLLSIGGEDRDIVIPLNASTVVTKRGVEVPSGIEKEYLKITSGIALV